MKKKTKLHSLLDPSYRNEKINRSIFLLKRTKSKRIKDKQFKKILTGAIEEKWIVEYKQTVLMKPEIYHELHKQKEQLKIRKNELEQQIGKK